MQNGWVFPLLPFPGLQQAAPVAGLAPLPAAAGWPPPAPAQSAPGYPALAGAVPLLHPAALGLRLMALPPAAQLARPLQLLPHVHKVSHRQPKYRARPRPGRCQALHGEVEGFLNSGSR